MLHLNTLVSEMALFLMLVVANFALTVGVALSGIMGAKFSWAEFPMWLKNHVLSLFVPWAVIAGLSYLATRYGGVIGWQDTGLGVVASIAFATITGVLLQRALTTFSSLGVTSPTAAAKKKPPTS